MPAIRFNRVVLPEPDAHNRDEATLRNPDRDVVQRVDLELVAAIDFPPVLDVHSVTPVRGQRRRRAFSVR